MFEQTWKRAIHKLFSVTLPGLILVLVISVFFGGHADAMKFEESTKAGHNMTGWAWSSNFGWVSFNSDTCDTNGNGQYDDGVSGCPTGAVVDYGVNMRYSDGRLVGYAWSQYLGWIAFLDDASGVTFDRDTGAFSGSALVNIYGAGLGRLQFDAVAAGNTPVSLVNDALDPDFGKASGWAWNNADNGAGLGWLSLSSANTGAGGGAYRMSTNLNRAPSLNNQRIWRSDPQPPVQVLPDPPGIGMNSVGDTIAIHVDTSDPDSGDKVRVLVCANNLPISFVASGENNSPIGLDSVACNGAASETLCLSVISEPDTDQTCSFVVTATTPNTYYTSVCDEYGYCSTPVVGNMPINSLPLSSGPNAIADSGVVSGAIAVITTPPLSSPDPEGNMDDHKISFSADWSDADNDGSITMYVCGSDSFNYDRNNLGCGAGNRQWCSKQQNVSGSSGTISDCDGEAVDGDALGLQDYFVFMCDAYGACTPTASAASGQFLVNRRPKVADGMSAPNWNPSDAASNAYEESDLRANLRWSIDDNDDLPANRTGISNGYLFVREYKAVPGFNIVDNTQNQQGIDDVLSAFRLVSSGKACDAVNCSVAMSDRGDTNISDMLNWGHKYVWASRVRDAYAWSELREYDRSDTAILTDDSVGSFGNGLNANENLNAGGDATSFATYSHNFPILNKTVNYLPASPSAMEEVQATPDSSSCYEDGYPLASQSGADIVAAAMPCDEASLDCTYSWVVVDSTKAELKSGTSWVASVYNTDDSVWLRFLESGTPPEFGLTVHDRHNYFDSNDSVSNLKVNYRLPTWQEK